MVTPDMVAAVKKHAKENYNLGWDTVVECYGDAEIREALEAGDFKGRPITTIAGAIRHFSELMGLHQEQEDNVMCQSGEHEKCSRCGHWFHLDRGSCDCV